MITPATTCSTETTYIQTLTLASICGGADNTRIQDAINNASNGGTIIVSSGTYIENVIVNKSVNLVGAGAKVTFVQAAITNNHTLNVTVNGVNISGFGIRGATGSQKAGINLYFSSNNNISENNISNNYYGIYLFSSSNNINYGNIFNNTMNVVLAVLSLIIFGTSQKRQVSTSQVVLILAATSGQTQVALALVRHVPMPIKMEYATRIIHWLLEILTISHWQQYLQDMDS